ncbi:hypothetical protein TTHERM_00170480 (macronuclear) [Tetrahymena thermophila SB210]|uniref:Kinase domain protein n=1 Tax=Tetrahymena thermophila (strain SB210) TaxID=312017 RepID=Q22TH8_TETTS|nr:hypothetical protein TTHERM_00170480 [Tetrahymena thermophila SB210]EAR88460.2 hypothetical protein TTHERM_00170480 [Tetrahymena thermophila SB210]|eukprot:XP_001008705.2 hypothetical protein TTHERM_00170480 [Tetrahymena thermophila SB210]
MNIIQEKLNGFVQKTFFKKKYIQMSQMLYIKNVEKAIKQLNEQNINDQQNKYTVLVLDFHLKKDIEDSLNQYLKFMEEKAQIFTNISSLYLNLGQTGCNFTLLMEFLKPFCNHHAQQKIKYLNIEFSENNTFKDTPEVYNKFINFLANCVNLEGACLNFNNSQLPICQIFEGITLLAVKTLHYNICQNNLNFFRTMFSRRFYFENLQELMINLNSSNESQSIDKQLLLNIQQSLLKAHKLRQLYLNLEKNSIKDRDLLLIQDIFANLPQLQNIQLYLAYNQISDEGVEFLLEKFTCTSQIQYIVLDFRQNNISNLGYLNIVNTLNKMPSLTHVSLNFNGNSIEQEGIQNFFQNASYLSNLTHLNLDFSNCQISFKSDDFIENTLKLLSQKLTYLTLNFCNNYLEAQGMQKILSSIKNAQSLKHIDINFNWNICNIRDELSNKQGNNNGSQDEIKDVIEKSVHWLSDIQFLLSNNRYELKYFSLQLANCIIESLGVEYLSKGLSNCENLQVLSLNLMNNSIDSEGYLNLFSVFKQMSLTQLKLIIDDNSALNAKELTEFERNMKAQKNLREFHFSSRKVEFQGDSFKTFAKGFSNLQKLTFLHLDLKLSKIQVKYTSDICNILVCSKHLNRIHFDISENGFDSDVIGEIFKSIQKNKNLKYLTFYAQNNRVQYKGVQSLVKNSNIKKLRYLDLNLLNCEIENKGIQELATFLQQFKDLHSLKINLWNNSINNTQTGSIIQVINQLPNLDYLSLNIGENEFNDDDLVKIYQALEKKIKMSYLELNLINISKGQESKSQLRKSLEKMNNIKYCNVIPFQSNLRQELIFHDIKLSPLNESQICYFNFHSVGQYYACGHGQYNLIRFLKNPEQFEENLIIERIVDGEMLDNLFQHLPKNIQTIHLMNMNQKIVAHLQQRLQTVNPKIKISSSGINGSGVYPQKQVDQNQSEYIKIKENEKSTMKKQQAVFNFDIEDQNSQLREHDSSAQNLDLCEEQTNNIQPDRKVNEFQQLVKVQLTNLQLQDVQIIKSRFVKNNNCYDINGPNYSVYYDTLTASYVAIKYLELNNFIQNQIDAHNQLFNIFQMHMKNFTQILQLKHYFIDQNHCYYITKAPNVTLKNFIAVQQQNFKEEQCLKWFIQIVDGLVMLDGIVSLQNLSIEVCNLALDENQQIVFMDIGNTVNILEKQMDIFLKQYKQKTIDLAIILFDFKRNDFNYLIFSIGIIFLQILSLDTDIKLIEKQFYAAKIEDLLFIQYNQAVDNAISQQILYQQNQIDDKNMSLNQQIAKQNNKKTHYSSVLIQLVQDCIFHQDVQKFKSVPINLQYVQSQLNLATSLLSK